MFHDCITLFTNVCMSLQYDWLLYQTVPLPLLQPTIIVGLHTCGDLAATCLKFFLKARQLTALCIVGCCYHHIKEEGEERGFPLSKFLLSLNFQLGRTMRMLALQVRPSCVSL